MNDRHTIFGRMIMLAMAIFMSLLLVACILLADENAKLRARLENEERTEEGSDLGAEKMANRIYAHEGE